MLARECAGNSVMVAGSMGPTGEIIEPLGSLSVKDAEDAFLSRPLDSLKQEPI